MKKVSITIDCPPGSNGRQEVLLKRVLSSATATPLEYVTVGKCFGEWGYSVVVPDNLSDALLLCAKDVLSRAYNDGELRYAEWSEVIEA